MLTHFSFFKWQNNPKYDRKKKHFCSWLLPLHLFRMGQHSQFWGKKHEWAVLWISRLSRLPSPCLSFIETRHRSQPNYKYVDFSGPSGTSHLAGGPSRCTRRSRVFLKLDWNQGPTIDDKAHKLTYFAVKTLPTTDNKACKFKKKLWWGTC